MKAFTRNTGLAVLCAAQFVVVLDATVVATALPAIGAGLSFPASSLSWVVTAYTVALAGLLISGGRAADLFGARRMFRLGLVVFSLASAGCALAPSPAALIAARVIQGLGAALLSPAALAALYALTPSPSSRRRALGWWTAAGAGGGASGWLLGGVITQLAGWPWVFAVNVPVGAAALLLTAVLPRSPAPTFAEHPTRGGGEAIEAPASLGETSRARFSRAASTVAASPDAAPVSGTRHQTADPQAASPDTAPAGCKRTHAVCPPAASPDAVRAGGTRPPRGRSSCTLPDAPPAGGTRPHTVGPHTASPDSGPAGCTQPDTVDPHTASPDTASSDAAPSDAAPPDAAPPDAAPPDAAPPDAARTDAARTDAASANMAARTWRGRLDLVGAVLATGGIALAVLALNRISAAPAGLPGWIAAVAAAPVLIGFVRYEGLTGRPGRASHPLLPARVLRRPGAPGGNLTAAALTGSTTPAMLAVVLYVQDTLRLSPARGAFLFPAFNLAVIAGSFAGPPLLNRFAARRVLTAGLVTVIAGIAVLLALPATGLPAALLLSAFTIMGAGLGTASVASTAAGTVAVPASERGVASGLLASAAQLGTGLGLAVTTPLVAAAAPMTGYRLGFGTAALVGVAGVAAARMVPRRLPASGAVAEPATAKPPATMAALQRSGDARSFTTGAGKA